MYGYFVHSNANPAVRVIVSGREGTGVLGWPVTVEAAGGSLVQFTVHLSRNRCGAAAQRIPPPRPRSPRPVQGRGGNAASIRVLYGPQRERSPGKCVVREPRAQCV